MFNKFKEVLNDNGLFIIKLTFKNTLIKHIRLQKH